MLGVPTAAGRWDEPLARAMNGDASPTSQVPKLFGPLWATASMEFERRAALLSFRGCRSEAGPDRALPDDLIVVRSRQIVSDSADARFVEQR